MSIAALFPNICTGTWVSHAAVSLCEGMAKHVATRMCVYTLGDGFRSPVVYPAVPAWATSLAYRVEREFPFLHRRTIHRYLRHLHGSDVCWLWPGRIADVVKQLRRRNVRIVLEATNCHQSTARTILDSAYARIGWPTTHGITDLTIAEEGGLCQSVDLLFAQSPMAAASFMQNGISAAKIITSSVGWCPRRMSVAQADSKSADSVTRFLFAGTVCIRKGTHLLLRAWRDAGVHGELLLAGSMATDFAQYGSVMLEQPHVTWLGYMTNIGHLMANAEVFVLPTLEEGGPMVTYEAAAMGLAIVTSPMGAGAIIRDGVDGIVLDPFDHDAWVQTLRQLACDTDLRLRLGHAARQRAQEFTWEKVARRRLDDLSARLEPVASTPMRNAPTPAIVDA